VPWCETCSRYWTPSSLRPGAECPTCGRVIARTAGGAEGPAPGGAATDEAPPVPWHFKLLLVAVALYLAFRAVQGVVWVAHHL